ncbi:CHC2 zinc finger family protein [Clostridium argentinense CDC 2741]|uniref:CHC2 zinc finger family protein n=1 Tax=Clostridium argentinense CDC 2741 TaxID=1418104 RepID=A0A0C1UHL9_9CLOT|nr:CHC2 zinc finger domain-containing protein [Clostridium argentinense]ARC85656.1 DNA primase [Clostridium argentinense]KIE46870.1 CHC2 zinc finger family protein [Clostridium argentinense CDC 2741]NFF40821.1 DNA primase [Clostridium argentinense]NFP50753.1 DNA primase [Clostridium argentinense]NFP73090.1 DNA primase [Clostridium argentinense]
MELQDIELKELISHETGGKFNREGYIKCPFHAEKTPSLSVKFHPDINKERFKCFGCGEGGDAIDFIIKYKDLNYIQAREYLGLEVEKTKEEIQIDKVKEYIDWELSKFREKQELLGMFTFVDSSNNPIYYKAKFMDHIKGRKVCGYYHLKDNKVIAKRGVEELPYNLYKTLQALKDEKVAIIVEGEKDANKLNSMLKGMDFQATSLKGVIDYSILQGGRIYVVGDTGKAGEKYKWEIHKQLFENSEEFRFINLPGIESLGDNKDVTDWIEVGNGKKELLNAFNRSLDLKNKYELQQDSGGVYKTVYSKKEDKDVKIYLTNFKVIEATRINFVDEDQEGVKLILKSATGETIERIGFSTVFDDTKTFKNFLGTMDLAFKGKVDELTDLKAWINRYFALENEEIHAGVRFIDRNGLIFIENNGAITKDKVDLNIKSDGRNNADVIEVENITKDELIKLKKYLFKFASSDKSISIIETIINNLAVYQCQELKEKLHHLLIVGESGSGKSTILENVIAPILNYPKKDIRSIGLITSFALTKSLSDGNYPILFDEFKPSSLDRYKIANLSETLRNLYDRATISKGNKSLKTKDFQLTRPIIIAGEESYPNQEKALIERSCIVYLSKRERTEKNVEAMKWILKNENLLNKLGRSLIEVILNLSLEEYRKLREASEKNIKNLKNRPLNTAINISTGIMILNKLLAKHNIKQIADYETHIVSNIENEVLDGGGDTYSAVEQMLVLYNSMIEDGRAFGADDVVRYRGDGIFIKTSEMINQIHEHINKVGADTVPLKLKDFRKQAQKAGYLESISSKVIKVGTKAVKFDTYNEDMLRELNVESIVPSLFQEVTGENKVIPFK